MSNLDITSADLTASLDFDLMQNDDDWLGFGYLGERRSLDTATRVERDTAAAAAMVGWTYGERFEWANSKLGRWYGESGDLTLIKKVDPNE